MKPGSVVVDMAAANGGNVAGSVPDQLVATANGVKILGYTDLPGRLPTQASQLFGTNLVNLLKLLTPGKDGRVVLDLDDVVQRGMTVCRDGETLWPPPPVQVSAAPAAVSAAPPEPVAPKPPPDPRARARRRYVVMALVAVVFGFVAASSPSEFLGHFTVFALAVIVGFYVISNVAHALHTPLMSETNAISGIILVGGLLQVDSDDARGQDPRPAGHHRRQHQHLRWLRRDRSHAPDVPEGLTPPVATLNLVQAAYIVAAVLFVLSLAGLSKHETAKEGNAFGVVGMVLALVATVWSVARPVRPRACRPSRFVVVAMAVGAAIGLWRARVVEMTQMPELVAMLHSFVGLAAVLVGFNSHLTVGEAWQHDAVHSVEVFLGVFIGAVTFTGSIVAFLKLSARIKSSPLMLPARHWLNLAALVVSAVLLVVYVQTALGRAAAAS